MSVTNENVFMKICDGFTLLLVIVNMDNQNKKENASTAIVT